MQSFEMYIFDRNHKLVAGQNVSNWSIEDVEKAIAALKTIDRTGIVSDKGRSVCCTCSLDLGECEVAAGEISHGYCTECYKIAQAEIDALRKDG